MANSGIYKIEIGPYYYYGQTENFSRRKAEHKYALKTRRRNRKMQNIFDKYKEFKFSILCYAEVDKLDWLESSLLKRFVGDRHCMNLSVDVGSPVRGMKFPDRVTEEEKKNISERNSGVYNYRSCMTEFLFSHTKSGGTFYGTPSDFKSVYKLKPWPMIERKTSHVGGWRVL